MGGILRKITGGSKPKPAAVQVVQKVTKSQTSKSTPSSASSGPKSSNGLGSYGGSTMMSSSQGVTEEANVAKTVLGGASAGKKKKPMAT